MTTGAVAAVAAAVLLLAILWLFFSRPVPLTFRKLSPSRLRELLAVVYYRGFDRAELRVGVRGSVARLSVAKDIVADNDVHLRAEITLADPWEEHWYALRQLLESLGLSYEDYASDSDTPARLRIDFGRDLDAAERFVRGALERASGSDVQTRGYARLHDVAEGRYKIGWTYPHAP